MNLEIELNDVAKSGIKRALIRDAADFTLKRGGCDFPGKKISVSFAILDKAEIKKINRIYRRANKVTDVLSFSEYKNPKDIMRAGDKVFLGEVVLCYNFIKVSTQGKNLNLEQELARTISHAILHLLGFKHGKSMFGIQDAAADACLTKPKQKK